MTEPLPPVWCSDHVLQRLGERCPELVGVTEDVIAEEVARSLAERRFACRKPRAIVPKGPRPRAGNRARRPRFVWTEDAERVYLVRRSSSGGVRGWVVVTVYTPLSFSEAAA